jgi:predicted nucleic acid-binding protein
MRCILAKAQGCEGFLTFDQRFAAVADTLSEVKVGAP